ncbi:MAG TPA: NifU family protein [Cryptosporangiaceae bacterium]|nr:NifU family protein [Cryptosporangiaceae bacterium]
MAEDARSVGEKIEALLDDVAETGDTVAVEASAELARLLMEFYGAGLARIVEALRADGPHGEELLGKLTGDRLVASQLILHGLHPEDTETRVLGALERVRPFLGSHAGGVEYLGIDEDSVVHLRLQGSCDGCPSSSLTVKMSIEKAISEDAPEIARVDVENITEPKPAGGLLQIQSKPPLEQWNEPCPVPVAL